MTSAGSSAGRGRIAAGLFAASALLYLFAVLLPAAASAATGSIAGTVTDASTGEPVEGVDACAESADESSFACGLTETDGTYLIGGLQPGEYSVSFGSQGRYVFQFYDGATTWSDADPVEVLSGTKTAGIDAELQPTAAIEGTVLATEDGLGVEEVYVCAYPVSAGEEAFPDCAETGADGTYEINGLAPGSYKIEFWPGWTGRNLAYQFYDHKDRFAEADAVTVDEGERKAGVDADLQPGASIGGHVSSLATGLPLEVRVCSIDATTDKLTVCTWTDEQGNYKLRFLTPDSYKVVFSPEFWEFFPGQAFPGEDDDRYPTQFWNNQTSLAAANVLSLGVGDNVGGVDARLGAPAPQVAGPPATIKPRGRQRPRKCRRGLRKKRVKGRVRCVRVRKRHRHRRGGGNSAKRPGPATVRFLAP